MTQATQFNELLVELARVQERFASIETSAEACCQGAARAATLAEQFEPAAIQDAALRKRAEGLSQSAQKLRQFEQSLRVQVRELSKPLQSLESLGLHR